MAAPPTSRSTAPPRRATARRSSSCTAPAWTEPSRAERLVLIGGALALPVNAALLTAARDAPARAGGMIAGWGLGQRGGLSGGGLPGASLDGGVRALLTHSRPGVLHPDLAACD